MRRALLVDFGGVLTTSVVAALKAFARRHGLAEEQVLTVLADAYRTDADDHPVARLERGEIDAEGFAAALRERLAADGLPEGDLVAQMLGSLEPDPVMWEAVRRARAAGIRTALVSNSWGDPMHYPRAQLAELFDALVISAEVGVRKPDPRIYLIATERVGVPPERCVFVDDHPANVAAAEALGMRGVLHRDAARTILLLEEFLRVRLR